MSAPFRTPAPDLPEVARTIHLRRQLAAAVDHGTALLAVLGLPRLVTPDFVALDPAAIGEAIEAAVATLDALDGDADLEDGADDEPSLGWIDGRPQYCGDYQDREHDTADAEPSLASPERHPRVPDFAWGPIYTARGGEEGQLRWAEGAHHDGEAVNEDGDDLDAGEHDTADQESYLGWPEDVGAVTSTETAVLTADPDAEHDDVDREDDELDDDRDPEPLAWMFGPNRREVAHA